jgi:hypothetical protein
MSGVVGALSRRSVANAIKAEMTRRSLRQIRLYNTFTPR